MATDNRSIPDSTAESTEEAYVTPLVDFLVVAAAMSALALAAASVIIP
jgi:hypothetical protein